MNFHKAVSIRRLAATERNILLDALGRRSVFVAAAEGAEALVAGHPPQDRLRLGHVVPLANGARGALKLRHCAFFVKCRAQRRLMSQAQHKKIHFGQVRDKVNWPCAAWKAMKSHSVSHLFGYFSPVCAKTTQQRSRPAATFRGVIRERAFSYPTPYLADILAALFLAVANEEDLASHLGPIGTEHRHDRASGILIRHKAY